MCVIASVLNFTKILKHIIIIIFFLHFGFEKTKITANYLFIFFKQRHES